MVRLVPPFVALLFAEALLYIAAVRANDTGDFFSPSHWARWDSGIYLSIAAHGYTDTPCPAGLFPPHTVCGSVGWAPLYPGLMSLLGHVGLTLPVAGMTLSILFTFLTLGAAWILIGPSFSASRLLCLAFAACFPGMIYYFAIFPISLFTFFALLSLIFFIRKHYVLAGLAGAVCCWAFYSGPLIIGVLVVAAILVERGPQIWKVVAQSAGIALAGFVALLAANRLWVGSWTAYLSAQGKYGNGLHNPVATFIAAFTGSPLARYTIQDPNIGYTHTYPQAQTAFVALLVIGLIVWTLRRAPVSRADWVILSYTVLFWLAPLVDGTQLSRYRIEALLIPCAALCTRLLAWCRWC